MNALAPLAAQSQRSALFDPAAFKRQADDQHQVLADQLAKRLGLKPEELAAKASDYTPEKVSERVLGFIEGRLSSEAAAGADDITLTDLEGRILMVSPSALKMFGYERADQMLGRLTQL